MPDGFLEHSVFRTCIHNLKRRVDGSFPAIPRCVFLKCTKHSRENAPCLAGKFFAHPASSAVNTGSYSLIGPFIIPSRDVSCVRTEVIWRASSFIKYRDIQGWRCVVTHDDGKQQIVYEGDYYPTNAIANHNSSLALAPYPHLYPGSDRYEIASWPK